MSARRDISFIIPVYNKADILPFVLKHLAAQDLPFAVEYIFVDDASQDGSIAVIEQRAATLGDVRIIRNAQNAGPSIRLNQGAREATGKYFCLLDADELIAPDAVKTMMALVAAERAEMIHGKVARCSSPATEVVPPPLGSGPAFVTCIAPLDTVLRTRGIVRMAWLVEAALFRAAGGCDERLFIQDEALPLRLASRARRMIDLHAAVTYAPPANSHLSADTRQQHHDRFFAYYHALRESPDLTAGQRRQLGATCISAAWKAVRDGCLQIRWPSVLALYLAAKLGWVNANMSTLETFASAFRRIEGIRRPATAQ